jgi:hypothetical protein
LNNLNTITKGKQYFITHNDLDGILSWLFLEKRGYKLGGVFNMNDLYLRDDIELEDCFAVDLDISLPGITSVGHHFLLFNNEDNWNPNAIWGVSDSQQFQTLNDYMRVPRFNQKCPLPTILLLHHLTKTPLPKGSFARSWFLYADGLYSSYTRYKTNVKNWLKEFEFDCLIDDLDSLELGKTIEAICAIIKHQSSRMTGRGFTPTKCNPYPQSTFKPLEIELLSPFLQTLKQLVFQSNHHISIPDMTTYMEGHYYQFYMNDVVYNRLQEKYRLGQIISQGLVYSNVVSATLTQPLNEQEDLELLRARTPRCVR